MTLKDIVNKIKGVFSSKQNTPIQNLKVKAPVVNFNTPPTYNQPIQVREEENPQPIKVEKTVSAADKLKSRLEDIKQAGAKTLSKMTDNEGFYRQGLPRPFAPIDDKIKKPVIDFINKNTIFANPESNNGDNFWGESGRGSKMAQKTPQQAMLEASPIGAIDTLTKNTQDFRPFLDKAIEDRENINNYLDSQLKAKWLGQKVVKPVVNTSINLLDQINQSAGNFSDAYRDVFYNTDGNKNLIGNIPKMIKSSAGAYAIGTGKSLLPSLLNAGSGTNFEKALTSAYTDVVTGTKQKNNIGGDDVASTIGRFIGGIAGWKQNPINDAGAQLFNTFIPYKDIINPTTGEISKKAWEPIKNKFINFIVTRGTRGALEDLVDNLSQIDEDASGFDNTTKFIGRELYGSLAEIISEKAFDIGGKVVKKLWDGTPIKDNAPRTDGGIKDSKTGKFFGNQYVKLANSYNQSIDSLKGRGYSDTDTFLPNPDNPNSIIRPDLVDPKTGKSKLTDNSKYNEMMGVIAGMETYQDEDGKTKIRFNPQKAALGMAVTGGLKRIAKTDVGGELLDKLKLPETPKTELDWKIENNNKTKSKTPSSIEDILNNRTKDINKAPSIQIKGKDIDVERLLKEGWDTNQVDYAIKEANKTKADIKNTDAYVRGILKKQYPKQASKMGGKSDIFFPPEPNAGELEVIDTRVQGGENDKNLISAVEDKLKKLGYNKNDIRDIDFHDQVDIAQNNIVKSKANTPLETIFEGKKDKVPTIDEIVNPRASSEATEPKTKTIKEILTPEQEKIRKYNQEQLDKLQNGRFQPDKETKVDLKMEAQKARSRYFETNLNKIKDLDLRKKVKDALSFDNWADENGIKKADSKSNDNWMAVYKAEQKLGITPPKTKPVITSEPKVEVKAKDLAPETKHYSKEEVKSAIDFETRVRAVEKIAQKEGIDLSKNTTLEILNGDKKVSSKLKTEIEKIQTELRNKEIEIGNENILKKEHHISDVDLRLTNTESTSNDNFADIILGSTFDASRKNTGAVLPENKAGWGDASIAEHRYIMRTKNKADVLTGKILEENNLPKEKAPQVKKMVEQELEVRKQQNINADKTVKKGKVSDIDYVDIEATKENKLNEIIGNGKKRPVIKSRGTSIDIKGKSLDDKLRTEATFFRDKTNEEVYDALIELRKAEKNTGEMNYNVALKNFYNKATKYDYEDASVKEGVNYYLNRRTSVNKVVESNINKGIRGLTKQLSRSQIGGNVKVMAEQPFEILRLAADDSYGIKKTKDAIASVMNKTESERIIKDYGLEEEKSGNVPLQEILRREEPKAKGIKKIVKKSIDALDNIIYKGAATTETWKNIVYAKAAETEGVSRGFSGQKLKSFVEKELIRIAHISDKGMTPRIMDSALGAGALQYQQYSMKQNLLLWNTLVGDMPKSQKAKQLTKYLVADYTAKAIMGVVTGVAAKPFGEWAYSMVEPKLGPLLTIPYNIAKNQIKYALLDEDEKEKTNNPLTSSTKETIVTAATPAGVQLRTKTKRALDIMGRGYDLSKKGNVNYVVGDMNPIQKTQAFLFGPSAIPAKKEADKKWDKLKEDGIYPTLNANQSAVLKSLPKEKQQAYYDQQMKAQVSNKKKMKDILEDKKPNLIQNILGKKAKATDTDTFTIPSKEATQQEKTQYNGLIKTFIDSGESANVPDKAMKYYFYDKVDKMPESTPSEKHAKDIARFKKLDSIYASETLDDETKDRLIELSGIPKEDVQYYNNAKDNATVKALRQEELAGQISREEWMEQLYEGRKLVGDKQIVDNATLNELYERGLLSDAERDYLIAIKYDPASDKFYLDRDYKNKQAGASATAKKKYEQEIEKILEKLNKAKDSSKKTITDYLSKTSTGSSNKRSEPNYGPLMASALKRSPKNITQILENTSTNRIKRKY